MHKDADLLRQSMSAGTVVRLHSNITATMLEGYALEIILTTANSAAQAWYGYEQVSYSPHTDRSTHC